MSEQLVSIPSAELAAICRRWQVRELALFGSTVRGEARPESDVEVLVDLEPNHTLDLFDRVDMIEDYRAIIEKGVGCPVHHERTPRPVGSRGS